MPGLNTSRMHLEEKEKEIATVKPWQNIFMHCCFPGKNRGR
jgi:hypothetical protein